MNKYWQYGFSSAVMTVFFLCLFFSAAYSADFSGEASCPVCRISYSAIVANDLTTVKTDFDGRLSGKKFLPLPECPMCAGVFAAREFSEDELVRLQQIIWTKDFQELKNESTRVRFAFLLEKLEAADIEIADAWLKTAWSVDDDASVSGYLLKSLGFYVQAYENLEIHASNRFATAVIIIDINRRLSRFSEAENWIKKALTDKKAGNKGHNFVLRELLALIRGKNTEPAEMPTGNSLHQAIVDDDYQKFEQHLKNRLLLDEENVEGLSPLLLAITSGRVRYVKALLTAGADIKAADDKGLNALHHALRTGSAEMFAMMIRAGADVNSRDSSGNGVLHHLAHLNNETAQASLFKAVVNKTADFNVRNFSDRTPLHLAAEEGAAVYVALLASAGANVNARLPDGSNVLFFCRPDIIGMLIGLGADILLKNNQGNTAFVQARLNADKARISAFRQTGLYGSPARKFDIAGKSWDINSAISENNLDVLGEILQQDSAQVNVHDDNLGETPLHKSVAVESIQMVKLLISAGANVNATSDFLRTPLHYAAATGNMPIVKMLIEAGASIFSLDARGSTALHAAAAAGHRRIYQLLISYGASDSTLDNSGYSPDSLLNGRQ